MRPSKGAVVTAIMIIGALACVLTIGTAAADLLGDFLLYRASP